MPEQKVTIELTEADNEVLLFCQKNYNNIKKLQELGIFRIKAKTVHLHIDPNGQIQNADIIIRCI